jgi:hypothetical protein
VFAIFKARNSGQEPYVLVPHLRGVIEHESRQTVKIETTPDAKLKIAVDSMAPVGVRPQYDEEEFFKKAETYPGPLHEFADKLRVLRNNYPGLDLTDFLYQVEC